MELMRLKREHAEAAAATFGRAFWDSPGFPVGHLPDEAERTRCFPPMWRTNVKATLRYGELYATSPELEGVAAWLPPGNNYLSPWQALMAAPIDTLRFLRHGGTRVLAGMEFVEEMEKRNAPMPHWHFGPIGVDPDFQGQGLASKLIRPMLERIDAEGLPVCLETNTEENIAIYERFGFEVKERADMPGMDAWTVSMLREPR